MSQTDGLVGYWKFDGIGGALASDSSGFANDGSLIWSPVSTSGRINDAIGFDGWDDRVLIPGDASLDITNSITLAAWLRPTAVGPQAAIKKARTGLTDGYELSLDQFGKIVVRFNQVTSVTPLEVHSVSSYPINGCSWTHAAATYDHSTIQLYINGVQESSLAATFTIATNTVDLSIGAQDNGPEAFGGLIDDVRIYNRALSPTEIKGLPGFGAGSDSVDAGPDQTVPLSSSSTATAALDGTICVDGKPGTAATTWSLVSGPANVTFANANAVDTQATFSRVGTYILRHSANFGSVSLRDDVTIAVREELNTLTVTQSTAEKPQSKLWFQDGNWWSVLPANSSDGVVPSSGAWLWRLDGNTWTPVLQLSSDTQVRADAKAVGDVTHILLEDGASATQLVSVQYVPGSPGTYQFWSARPGLVSIPLDTEVRTATIDTDSTGCMWLASDASTDITVRSSASPYTSWSAPVTIATGISIDDISVVTALPAGTKLPNGTQLTNGGMGVLWSNQVTKRWGFRVHATGSSPCANPSTWSADEVPDSTTAAAYQNVGFGMPDNHLNVAVASDGTLYAAVKTSFDLAGYPQIGLLVRRPSGTWDPLYSVDGHGTRPIVLLSETESRLFVVYTSSKDQPRTIIFKRTLLPNIAFGPIQTLIAAPSSGLYNDAASTKQNISGEFVVLGSNCSPSVCPSKIVVVSARLDFQEGNHAPVLTTIGSKSVGEGSLLTFTATATDPDVPPNAMTFSLDSGAPAGARIDPVTGAFSWTPSESQGPGTYLATVRVTDNGSPNRSDYESVKITVNEVNSPPDLAPIGDKSVDEGGRLTFTAKATDPDLPANTLSFSLDRGAPTGARIDPVTGDFTWTTDESHGPGSYPVTVRVTDNGSPSLSDSETITVTVKELNVAPVLAAIGNKSVCERSLLSFTATATDPDVPANTLTFSLDAGSPAGAGIDPTTGDFTWTPSGAQGPADHAVTVRVTDNGPPNLSDSETITITVHDVKDPNEPPELTAIGDKSVDEGNLLSFTATATDSDILCQILRFSLDPGAPAGASIDATTGEFTWKPSESEGPGSYSVTVRVTDDGSPSLSDSETITVTVKEVNVPPVMATIGDRSVKEGNVLIFTATATDLDVPANSFSFSLDPGAPAGASIDPATGDFTWAPSELQGSAVYVVTVRVNDNGSPILSDSETIRITVGDVNEAPVLGAIGDQSVNEGSDLSFTATATDPDVPADTLSFGLDPGAPAGTSIDPVTGLFTWTPTESQGPGTYALTVLVTDGGSPAQRDFETITITVGEVNEAPALGAIGDQSVDEGSVLRFAATATDPDVPANTFSFSLDPGAPAGASIDPLTGVFTWTPSETQGPGSYAVTVGVADSGTPAQSDFETITIAVGEVNAAPVLGAIGDQSVDEASVLSFTATAMDPDVPANTFSFGLDPGAPAEASIDPVTGVFTWTPSESQGPGTYALTVRVRDNVSPGLSDSQRITIRVSEVNEAPLLGAIGGQSVDEGSNLSFTAMATDPDAPANTLSFSLDPGAPAGAGIDPVTGVFTWTPTESQGPGSYAVTVRVADSGSPSRSAFETITITVRELNEAPVLATIGDQSVDEGSVLSFTVTATDPDMPSNKLSFSLDRLAPTGASIDPTTGVFAWTPNEIQGPGRYLVTVQVADDGSPKQSEFETITITVHEVNESPVLATIDDQLVDEGTMLRFTATAMDPDLPPNIERFSLDSAPAGASIDPATGVFTWTPLESDGPGTYSVTVRVTDDGSPTLSVLETITKIPGVSPSTAISGSPNLSALETITITVREVNDAPVLAAIGDRSVDEGSSLRFTALAMDPDVPADMLSFSLAAGAPAGASIDPSTGVFTWTPSESQGPGTYPVTVRVTDTGSPNLSAFETITITVRELNEAPVLAAIGDRSADEGSLLRFTALAMDPDVPANMLSFSLAAGAPAGASIDPVTGVFTWTPSESQGPGTYPVTMRVTDTGSPNLSAFETITITVRELNEAPVLAAIGDRSADEGSLLRFTALAMDPDVPANMLSFSLAAGAPAGASIDPSTGVFTWTPSESQGPGTYPVTVRVTDTGSPNLSAFENITITVNEVNRAPVLAAIGDRLVDERNTLSFTATASDPDSPRNTLSFSLAPSAPAGARIDPATGIFTWTPSQSQGAGLYPVTVRVTDDGAPSLSDFETITITVLDITGPIVADVQLRARLTKTVAEIVLVFTEPLNSSNAALLANYTLELAGRDKKFSLGFGAGDDTPISLSSAHIDSDLRTVHLIPNPPKPLKLTQAIEIIVHGTGATRVTDGAGNDIDGDQDGVRGGDFAAIIGSRFSYLDDDGDTASLSFTTVTSETTARADTLLMVRRADGEYVTLPSTSTAGSVLFGKVTPRKSGQSDRCTVLRSITGLGAGRSLLRSCTQTKPGFRVGNISAAAVDSLLESDELSRTLRSNLLIDSANRPSDRSLR